MTTIHISESSVTVQAEPIFDIAIDGRVEKRINIDKSQLVAYLLFPQIKLLMDKSESELMQMHLDMMKGCEVQL